MQRLLIRLNKLETVVRLTDISVFIENQHFVPLKKKSHKILALSKTCLFPLDNFGIAKQTALKS